MSGPRFLLPEDRLGRLFAAGGSVLLAERPALLDRLEHGEADAALLDTGALLRAGASVEIVPGAAVRSFGRSGLGLLRHDAPLDRIAGLAVEDPGSAAALLARLLFAGSGRRCPVGTVEAELPQPVGRVFEADTPPSGDSVDLGEAWSELTGLPFVWAVWATLPGRLDRPLYGAIHRRIREAARKRSAAAPAVAFRLGRAELSALRRFREELARHDLGRWPPLARLAPIGNRSSCTPPD